MKTKTIKNKLSGKTDGMIRAAKSFFILSFDLEILS